MSVEMVAMREALSRVRDAGPKREVIAREFVEGNVVFSASGNVHQSVIHISVASARSRELSRMESALDGFLDSLETSTELTREGMHRALVNR